MNNELVVNKFGGSSLANTNCYARVAKIIGTHLGNNDWIVVSASGKTTDKLTTIYQLSLIDEQLATTELAELIEYQRSLLASVLDTPDNLIHQLEQDQLILDDKITTQKQARHSECEYVCYGEIWSAKLMTQLVKSLGKSACFVNATDILSLGERCVDLKHSYSRLEQSGLLYESGIKVVTGFIASDANGKVTTLGRNGSDFSASLFASLISAQRLEIWTDVKGVFSSDPRVVKNAIWFESIDWYQADAMARAGSKILHPETLSPLKLDDCQVIVRSSLQPEQSGTKITKTSGHTRAFASFAADYGLVENISGSVFETRHIAFGKDVLGNNQILIFPEYKRKLTHLGVQTVSIALIGYTNTEEVIQVEQLIGGYKQRIELARSCVLYILDEAISESKSVKIHASLVSRKLMGGVNSIDKSLCILE
ncbi:hypothetical protein PULV_a3979 [Pseudoalteromonas ulvae UL12]|uniref:amino acid kinase family protein n=1 Tax=Pseudoalteromonas ulvae TaxID=107327 RepID=UPI00186B81E9|nr:hypothetical protein [Pseudoalteromonas ulvae]MBE0362172.1 hypothetical protein [Pseudoalteromonas ulvae UL12]